jgi:hypothetical protein
MRRASQFAFLLLVVVAVAAGCGGHGQGPGADLPVMKKTNSSTRGVTRGISYPIWTHFIVFSGKTHRVISDRLGWFDPKSPQAAPQARTTPTPSSFWTPQATPSPGFCNNGVFNPECFYLIPGGDSQYWQWSCSGCTYNGSSPPPVEILYSPNPGLGFTLPPPGVTVEVNTSINTSWANCNSGCDITGCSVTNSSCWIGIDFSADVSVVPQNWATEYNLTLNAVYPISNYVTTLPTVYDLNITTGSSYVTYPGPATPLPGTPIPFPSPIMVGQQVQLEASPDTMLTGVQWSYEANPPTDVVGGYGLTAPTSRPSVFIAEPPPSPAPNINNPIALYWLSGGSSTSPGVAGGIRHVRMTAQVSGVTGPLFADVYYPVVMPSPVQITVSPGPAGPTPSYPLYNTWTWGNFPVGTCTNPIEALSAGDMGCTARGITWTFSAGAPGYGAGSLAVAQLLTAATVSGTLNGNVETATPSPQATLLDGFFPEYGITVSTGSTLTFIDSPDWSLSGQNCTKLSTTESFVDYFMYQPTAGSRPSIWVTLEKGTWGWTGSATLKNGAWSGSGSVSTPTYSSSTELPWWPAVSAGDAFFNPGELPQCYPTPTPSP